MAVIGPVSFVELDGAWVGYRTIGELGARPFLFVPTAAGMNIDSVLEYEPLRRFFVDIAELGGVVLFDRRGTGVSDDVPGRIAPTLEDWAEDALAVLGAVDAERVVLLGHGMGTPSALVFAAGHPDRMHSLVTFNGFARYTRTTDYDCGRSPEIIDRVAAVVAESWGEGSVYFQANPDLSRDPELLTWVARSERNTFGRAAAVRAWRTWLALDVREVVPSVQTRALVTYGVNDRHAPMSRWLGENLPNAEVFEFDNETFDWWYLEGRRTARDIIASFVHESGSTGAVERTLATVLFTDIVDSTRRATALGDERWRAVLDRHDRISHAVIAEHRGRFVKQTGDGVLATFDGPARAVECARALATSLDGAGIPVRAGLHCGEVEVRGDDVAGLAVHIAARVAAAASASEVLVSRTIPDLVAGSRLRFDPRGTHHLKGVDGEWELFAVA